MSSSGGVKDEARSRKVKPVMLISGPQSSGLGTSVGDHYQMSATIGQADDRSLLTMYV